MSTQYDTIQAPYDQMRKCSVALIERANVQSTLAPFIKDARVLDLACGSGFYSYQFLKWGASKVLGVDISAAMIGQARTGSSQMPPNTATIDFTIADCSKPVSYEGGPFDIVFGAWLLNYAPSGKDMVDMFRNVALNLRDGGHFVAVTPPPTQDPAAFVEAETKARPDGSGGLFTSVTGVVEDGFAIHLHADTSHGDVDFDCYHLRKEVFEASAREGGLRGELAWSVTAVPDEFFKDRTGGASVGELGSHISGFLSLQSRRRKPQTQSWYGIAPKRHNDLCGLTGLSNSIPLQPQFRVMNVLHAPFIPSPRWGT